MLHLLFSIAVVSVLGCISVVDVAAEDHEIPTLPVDLDFDKEIKPILAEYCFDCHGDGAEEGGVSLDELFQTGDGDKKLETWHRVLKQIRAELMPPVDEAQPSDAQIDKLASWIIRSPLKLDPERPNPGKLTLRRLNRVEYRNTIRDLLGVDFDTSIKFPADDAGHGFDNISDVLSISPLLLEKYFNAAEEIVHSVVPTTSSIVRKRKIDGAEFVVVEPGRNDPEQRGNLELSYYEEASATASVKVEHQGEYKLKLNLVAVEQHVENAFDSNKCEFVFFVDGEALMKREFVRQGGKYFPFEFDRELSPGEHEFKVYLKPITNDPQVRRLRLIVESVDVIGPLSKEHFIKPENYDRFFPQPVPDDPTGKHAYAKQILNRFAQRAFRRPLDEAAKVRLADFAESIYQQEAETFESAVAKGMTAILASPRFVFREEFPQDGDDSEFPLIDEHALASRLSYFLWSSMPDEELIRLADEGQLRKNLDQQIQRMMDDEKFTHFIENFAGQWLQARTIETVQIDSRSVQRREAKPDPEADKRRERFFELFRKGDDRTPAEEDELKEVRTAFRRDRNRGPRIDLSGRLRYAMRRETELLLEFIIKEDRSLLELIDNNYTFLNEDLADHYQIEGIEGRKMRRVELPADSIRGGVLTQGTFLAVTSNPNRTSPVKRGLFVLENLLGTPTASPPPDLPSLEDQENKNDVPLSLRDSLALHREDPACSSCHNRMDPLGLALENFNALGRYRVEELGQPIDSKGVLITGEEFNNVTELKKILASSRKSDFYRCLSEKMLTYALGRAVEYGDIPVVDSILEEVESNQRRASVFLKGINKSAPIQRIGKLQE